MTKLKKNDVAHIADLAKLPLTDQELEKFAPQLSSAIDYVHQLSEVDTHSIEMPPQLIGLENVFREDEVKPSLSQEEALANGLRTYKGFFVVDGVLEAEDTR